MARFRVFRNGYITIQKTLEFKTKDEALKAIEEDVQHLEATVEMPLKLIGVLNRKVLENAPLEVRVYEYHTLYQEVYTILRVGDQD